MNIFCTLNLRTEFEKLITRYDLPNKQSDINSLRYFVEEGHKKNRFRKHYVRALEIADEIVGEYDGTKDTRSELNIRSS